MKSLSAAVKFALTFLHASTMERDVVEGVEVVDVPVANSKIISSLNELFSTKSHEMGEFDSSTF